MFKISILTSVLLIAPPVLADLGIEDIAPETTFLILGVDNARDTMAHFQDTTFWEMLHAPEMDDAFEDSFAEFQTMIEMVEAEAGLDEGELQWPGGPAGFALFMAMNDDLGIDTLGMMAMADFAGETEVLQKLMERGLEQADIDGTEFEELEVMGRVVYAFDMPESEDDEEFNDVPLGPFGDPGAMLEPLFVGLETMYVTRVDDTLLVCTNLSMLQQSMESLVGEEIASAGETEWYQEAIDTVGRHDAHVVFNTDGFVSFSQMQPMLMIFGPMLAQPLNALGLNSIQTISMSFDLNSDDAALVQRAALLVDGEKRGLVNLFAAESPRRDMPGFVSPEAVGISRVNIRFSGVMDIVNSVFDTVPPEFLGGIEGFMLEYGDDLNDLTTGLGNEMFTITHGGDDGKTFAIRTTNPQRVESALARLAPNLGLEARDFAGSTVYSNEFAPMALGIGGGYVFFGAGPRVEDALRAAIAPPAEGFAADAGFVAAAGMIGTGPVVAWGYTDTGAMLESMRDTFQQQLAMMPVGAQGMDGLDNIPDSEFVTRYIGPSAWSVRSIDNGFVMKSYILGPVEEK